MLLASCIEEYLVECEIRKFTTRTLKHYRLTLNLFLKYCEEEKNITKLEELNIGVVKSFTRFFISNNKKATYINSLLKVIKVFLKWSYEEFEEGTDIKKHPITWCKEEKPVILTFKNTDVKYMLNNCNFYLW